MTIDVLRNIAMALPAATEDIKWDVHLCFNVGAKMFLITSPDDVPVNATLKVPEENYHEMLDREGFTPASHLSRYHWVNITDIGLLSKKEWEFLIRQSYDLVVEKLPRKTRQSLSI